MAPKAFIAGLTGLELAPQEREFFRAEDPWGFILFARNVDTPEQVTRLTHELRSCVGREDAPVLMDQEGGRVQRLRPPHWEHYPAGAALGALYEHSRQDGLRAAWLMSRLHAFDLLKLGITVDCLPVLDVPSPDGHEVIGDRAYGRTPKAVTDIGRAAAEGLISGGVMPVIKHIPGHGRAAADSHLELPVVEASLEALESRDFPPFHALRDMPMAMTAHVIYRALDESEPATTSKRIIETIIRDRLGFDGLLMSDDVSMNALSGDYSSRTQAIFEAGCDAVLHCNGDMGEMAAVAEATPVLKDKGLRRAEAAISNVGKADSCSEADCREEFAKLMSGLAVA